MKILHTADWHLNDTLGRVDRSKDLFGALEQIAVHLEDQKIDVMLVAGDLFSERSRPDQTRAAISEIRRIFLPFLQRGGTIVCISGNHDSEIFLETLRDALDLVAPGTTTGNGLDPSGRLYVAPAPALVRLSGRDETIVQFVLMPFPTARAYLRGQNTRYGTVEEKQRAIRDGFNAALAELEARLDPMLPRVLMSHLHVRGAQMHSLYRVSEAEDILFDAHDIPSHWAYVAYGHIHKAQALGAKSHIRYAGSIERLDAAERADQKSVVTFDIGPNGLRGEPQTLPLEATPLYRVEVTDPAQIPGLAARYPHSERALVRYVLHWQPGRDHRGELARAIQKIFPRWYGREFIEVGKSANDPNAPGQPIAPPRLRDVPGTVREYLGVRLATHAQRDELHALAESLLAEQLLPDGAMEGAGQ